MKKQNLLACLTLTCLIQTAYAQTADQTSCKSEMVFKSSNDKCEVNHDPNVITLVNLTDYSMDQIKDVAIQCLQLTDDATALQRKNIVKVNSFSVDDLMSVSHDFLMASVSFNAQIGTECDTASDFRGISCIMEIVENSRETKDATWSIQLYDCRYANQFIWEDRGNWSAPRLIF